MTVELRSNASSKSPRQVRERGQELVRALEERRIQVVYDRRSPGTIFASSNVLPVPIAEVGRRKFIRYIALEFDFDVVGWTT